jgi:CRISPR-associated protein Cas2
MFAILMFIIVVYDTESKNCVKLHKYLKRYLQWNQNSVFEGTITPAQYLQIKQILDERRAPRSHITLYTMGNEKLLTREEIGTGQENISNIL